MADIRSLREEALKRHRAAGRKVARLKRERGVSLAGTEFDPRVSPEKLKRYNSRQLSAYIERVNQFTRRSVQFTADYRGRPIRGAAWQEYKDAERRYNRYVQRRFAEVQGIQLPEGGTIADRMAVITPRHQVMGQVSVSAPYNPVSRKPSATSAAALSKLGYDLRRRSSMEYRRAAVSRDRATLRKMLAIVGDHDMQSRVDQLSDAQFELLWNYTDFATDTGIRYGAAQAELRPGGAADFEGQVAGDALSGSRRLVEWAGKQDIRSRL